MILKYVFNYSINYHCNFELIKVSVNHTYVGTGRKKKL